MASIRETYEETGLILGIPADWPIKTRSKHWSSFFNTGLVPAVHKLKYFARAITPPGQIRRYDTRFFLTAAANLSGTIQGNGELIDLRWEHITQTEDLNLSPITRLILRVLTISQKDKRSSPDQILKLMASNLLRTE